MTWTEEVLLYVIDPGPDRSGIAVTRRSRSLFAGEAYPAYPSPACDTGVPFGTPAISGEWLRMVALQQGPACRARLLQGPAPGPRRRRIPHGVRDGVREELRDGVRDGVRDTRAREAPAYVRCLDGEGRLRRAWERKHEALMEGGCGAVRR